MVRGRLQKDGLTTNVIAHTVKAVRVREDAPPATPALPGAQEGWTESERGARTPFQYLTALRQSPLGIKNFG